MCGKKTFWVGLSLFLLGTIVGILAVSSQKGSYKSSCCGKDHSFDDDLKDYDENYDGIPF